MAMRLLAALALLALFTGAILILGARDYGGGVDGGVHYSIADEFTRLTPWPFPKTSTLYWISFYPPGSHILAAGLGLIAGSTLHGLFILTAISIVAFYLVVADLMRSPSLIRTIGYLVAFIALSMVFRNYRFLAGNEMIGNFFFSQLAGNAALMLGFYIAYRTIQLSLGRWLFICAIAVHIVGWFYPLSAIELAAAAAILRGAPMTRLWQDTKRRLVEIVVSGVVLGAAAILHPTIIDMLGISANDGGITITNEAILAIVAGTVILIPVFFHHFQGTGSVRAGAIFALSLGALSPCIAIGLLSLAGLGGSAYAVKKSAFLLGTAGVMMLSILIVEWTARLLAPILTRLKDFQLPASAPLHTIAACGFVALVIVVAFNGRERESVKRLISIDRDLRELLAGDASDQLYGQAILMISSESPHANFVIGYPILRQGAGAPQHSLFLPGPPDLTGRKFVVVGIADKNQYEQPCVLQSTKRLAVITADCVAAKKSPK